MWHWAMIRVCGRPQNVSVKGLRLLTSQCCIQPTPLATACCATLCSGPVAGRTGIGMSSPLPLSGSAFQELQPAPPDGEVEFRLRSGSDNHKTRKMETEDMKTQKECKHLENHGARMESLWSAEHMGMPPPTKRDTAEPALPPDPVHATR